MSVKKNGSCSCKFKSRVLRRKGIYMKKVKIVSLLIVFVMVLCSMVSCFTPDASKLMEKATEVMNQQPYTITMDMKYSTDDETLGSVFDSLTFEDVKVNVDGEKMSIKMDMDMGIAEAELNYILISKTMYMNVAVSGMSQAIKQKATLSDEDFKEFKEEMGISAQEDILDFSEMVLEKVEDTYVITCTGASEEFYESINESMEEMADSLGGSCTVSDLKYVVEIKDGKFKTMQLSATYEMSVEEKKISVDFTMDMDIDYDVEFAIEEPADKESYEEVDFSNIMG